MKVLTISQNELKNLSHKLLSMINDDTFTIDMIIGIATGGIYVSSPIEEQLRKEKWSGKYYETKLSRKSTETKKNIPFKFFFSILPYFILNFLRNIEVYLFENFKSQEYNKSKEDGILLPQELIEDLKDANSLLLVDDAIDTGSTILAIKNVIENINPNIKIKVAVLTVTHKHPYIEPDYMLYRRTLLRCPWAEDYKGSDKIG